VKTEGVGDLAMSAVTDLNVLEPGGSQTVGKVSGSTSTIVSKRCRSLSERL
jgi:hypothetical protein